MKTKGQGLVPSWLIGVLLAVAFLVLMVVIAVMYKGQLSILIDKILGIFRFGE